MGLLPEGPGTIPASGTRPGLAPVRALRARAEEARPNPHRKSVHPRHDGPTQACEGVRSCHKVLQGTTRVTPADRSRAGSPRPRRRSASPTTRHPLCSGNIRRRASFATAPIPDLRISKQSGMATDRRGSLERGPLRKVAGDSETNGYARIVIISSYHNRRISPRRY